MHLDPERYQYYFEKFLRNEMKSPELEAFESRLQQDPAFFIEFERYKTNRQEILNRELQEYEFPIVPPKKPQSWGWLYLVVSVLLLVLLVDYYINQKYSDELALHRKSLVETIGIIPESESVKAKEAPKQRFKVVQKEKRDSLFQRDDSLYDAELELAKVRETDFIENSKEDVLLADSLFSSIAFSSWEEKLQSINIQPDSLPTDSAILNPILRGLFKKNAPKAKGIFVEFWSSNSKFTGYKYTGKKLVLYGVNPESPIFFLYSDLVSTHAIILQQMLIPLVIDQQYHKLPIK